MRLIHVVPALAEEASGPTYSVSRLCEALIEKQLQVTLATLDWAPRPNHKAYQRAFPLGIGPRRLGRSPEMYRWLRKECISQRVDIIHNHGMWQMNAVYPAWALRRTQVALVCSPRGAFSTWAMNHGSIVKRLFWPLLQMRALQSATCFHATAQSEYEDIRRMGFKQPIAVIPNGIDINPLPARGTPKSRTLLFLGRIHEVKGLDVLIEAWRAVEGHFPEWNLEIVGGDEGYRKSVGYLEELQDRTRRLGIKRILFRGALYGTRKMQAYRDAELYVLPTYSENFGMTVAEALSMGTPAIVSKGAPWGGLESQGAGWWIDIGAESLAACLRTALSQSREVLKGMGQRGLDWMRSDFSWESVGTRMTETYQWLCDRSLPVPSFVRMD